MMKAEAERAAEADKIKEKEKYHEKVCNKIYAYGNLIPHCNIRML